MAALQKHDPLFAEDLEERKAKTFFAHAVLEAVQRDTLVAIGERLPLQGWASAAVFPP